jgi:hypothetical protein
MRTNETNQLAAVPGLTVENLGIVLGLAESQIEDVTTGLADGTYDAADNPDHKKQSQVVAQLRDLIDANGGTRAADLVVEGCASAASPSKSVTFYFDAYACDEHADGPQAAKLCVNQAFVDKLLQLQGCLANTPYPLSEVRTLDHPTCWLPEGVEDELVLTLGELVVTNNFFWFTDCPDGRSDAIVSEGFGIADLVSQFNTAVDGQAIVWGDCNFLCELKAELTGAVVSS